MGSRAQQAAQVLLLAWQIDAALVLLLFSADLNACSLSRCVEPQIQTPVSIADVAQRLYLVNFFVGDFFEMSYKMTGGSAKLDQ